MADEPLDALVTALENAAGEVRVIAEAVGASSSVRGDNDLAKRIEAAMSQAVTDALAEGISMDDTETIKARMKAARQAVLNEAR